jgi:hypothetical protein
MLRIAFIRYAQNNLHQVCSKYKDWEQKKNPKGLNRLNKIVKGYSEHTWWRLFWAYLMKVIMSIPDEGYSEHTWWRLFWAYLMKVILSIPDEGYSRKLFMGTKLDLYVLYHTTPYSCRLPWYPPKPFLPR